MYQIKYLNNLVLVVLKGPTQFNESRDIDWVRAMPVKDRPHAV